MTEPTADSFTSIAGVAESAEPTSTSTDASTPNPSTSSVNTTMRHHNNGKRPLHVSGSPSANSPQTSRDSSPARPVKRTNTGGSITNTTTTTTTSTSGAAGLPRPSRMSSRKSSTDVSPNRAPSQAAPSTTSTTSTTTTTVPSAAAIQRALSSTNMPSLPPSATATQDSARVPRPTNTASANSSGNSTPHWPPSPRFKSPPPPDSRSRRNSLRTQQQQQQQPQQQKKPDTSGSTTPTPPAIVVLSSSPASSSRVPVKDEIVPGEPDEPLPMMKTVSRGTSGAASKLETVQESSQPTTPGFDEEEAGSLSSTPTGPKLDDSRSDILSSKVTEDLSGKTSKQAESGSDNAIGSKNNKGKTQETRSVSAAAQRPLPLSNKPSLASLHTIRSRNEPPLRNMTVETETVPSVAQPTIGTDRSISGRADGSLRLKPSNETIRPKKEKKHAKRKAPSINSSSKADVFEQKVATAVDEAESSDSDATFIYESNPPEQPHRSRHHHSRTPSMTSMVSVHDRVALRESHKNPNKKSSMKFANPYNNANGDLEGDRDGIVRVGSGRISGGSHHHHIGRHGQGRGTLSHMMDSDSSMPQSSRARGPSSRQPSQPNSPRFHTFSVGNGSTNGSGTKKHGEYSTYDIDNENAADDERTPLIASRSPRVRTPRRRNSATLRPREHRHRRGGGWCRKFAGCLVLVILLLVIIFSAVGLVFATTKPLTQLDIREIQNVIASQEEIILDLVVDAINPNIIGVTVADMDVIIFAKSKHVGSDKWWREHGQGDEEDWLPIKASEEAVLARDGVDHGTDPIEDGEPHIMSLGRIFHFDAPLNFDGTFFKHRLVESIGEIRLLNPGNKTEAGGTERWEEVLQYPFELIVRGSFKYQLPLSTTERRVPVTATYFYDPDAEKKRLKTQEEEKERQKNLFSTLVSSTPLGRFDRRAISLRFDSQ